VNRLRLWYEGLSDRERKLVVVFGVVFAATILFLVPFTLYGALSESREHNEALRSAIRVVQASRGRTDVAKEQQDRLDRRYDEKLRAPALAGFIENAARKSELEIPESKDGADVPHGKDKEFVERSTSVRLRKVSLLPLVRMLETIENAGHPIVVSRLNVKKRGREPDSYDVELGVSAFDRVDKKGAKSSSSEGKP